MGRRKYFALNEFRSKIKAGWAEQQAVHTVVKSPDHDVSRNDERVYELRSGICVQKWSLILSEHRKSEIEEERNIVITMIITNTTEDCIR